MTQGTVTEYEETRVPEVTPVADAADTPAPQPEASCRNCGFSPLASRYCPDCGQENVTRPAPLRILIADILEEFLKWDGRLFHTLRLLLFRPGQLSREYNEGKRVCYLSPFKMYFVISALFFTAVTFQMTPELKKLTTKMHTQKDGKPRTIDLDNKTFTMGRVRTEFEAWQTDPKNKEPVPRPAYYILRRVAAALDAPDAFFDSLLQTWAKAVLLLVPVYAGFLALLYWRQKRFFVEHLIFSVHLHTFSFLLLSILFGIIVFAPMMTGWFILGMTFLYPFYEFKALRHVYGQGFFRTWFKQSALATLYIIATIIAFVLATEVALETLVRQ